MVTNKPWPALSYREHPWTEGDGVEPPRRRRAAFTGPYRAAVVPNIAKVSIGGIDSNSLIALTTAAADISRFDAELGHEIAAFAPLLLRSESAASSKIENLTASVRAIALAELGDPSRRNASLIVANTRAMQAAIDLADRLDEQAILDMHATLMGDNHPDWVGHWRDEQVWIGGSDYGPHDALFVPPVAADVPEAMKDLVAFIRRSDLPPLVQVCLAHAQFETIHPFPDGNGRAGRALIHSVLRAKGLVQNITIPVSAGLLADTDGYFDALTQYREGNPSPLLLLLADATSASIHNARLLVEDLHGVAGEWTGRITVRKGAGAHKLSELLLRQPVIDSPLAQRELSLAAPNVNTAIEHLETVGILNRVSGNFRNRKWAAGDVLDALERFSRRASRRR